MFSDNLTYVVILLLVLFGAISVNGLIEYRSALNERRRKRLKWLGEQSSHTLNALAVLRQAGCRNDIIEKIDQHAMSLIEEIAILSPKLNLAIPDSDAMRRPADAQALTSDRAIRRAQIYINFAEKLVMELARGGRLTLQLAQTYRQELQWLGVSIVADGHQNQARTLLGEDKTMAALSHLKHAKAVVVRAPVPQDQKQSKLASLQAEIDRLQQAQQKAATQRPQIFS